jgi:hypothetical protein
VAHATGIGFVDPPGLKMRNIRTLERGIALLRFSNVSVNPLLTRRAMIFPFVSAPLVQTSQPQNNEDLLAMNFKPMERGKRDQSWLGLQHHQDRIR